MNNLSHGQNMDNVSHVLNMDNLSHGLNMDSHLLRWVFLSLYHNPTINIRDIILFYKITAKQDRSYCSYYCKSIQRRSYYEYRLHEYPIKPSSSDQANVTILNIELLLTKDLRLLLQGT